MKNTFHYSFWLFASLLFTFNFSLSAQVVQHPNAERDTKMAQEARAAYVKGDWDKYKASFTANAMAYNVEGKDSMTVAEWITSSKAYRANLTSVALGDGPILPLSIAEGAFAGDWIFEWNDHSVVQKDGKKVSFLYHLVSKLKDGKIERITFYYDAARILQQQGWTFTLPAKK
mgnify:CR=1 FL=1